jgi:hypothetical protein
MSAEPAEDPHGGRRTMRLRPAVLRVGLLLGGIVVAFALAEGGVRLAFPHARDHVIPGGVFEIDDLLGWKLQPGKRATHRTRSFEVEYEANTHGHRDRPRDPARRTRSRRLLLYGDSQVFGWGVERAQRFSDLLEERLPAFEICNLAVPGYGLDQQVLAYERDGASWVADEVAFFVSPQTLGRVHTGFIYDKPKPRFVVGADGVLSVVPPAARSRIWRDWAYRLLSPFHLPYFAKRQLAALRQSGRGRGGASLAAAAAAGELERGLLVRIGERARARGHRPSLVVCLPESLRTELRQLGDAAGLAILDLSHDGACRYPELSAFDPHWNTEAHAQVAELLASRLAGEGEREGEE